jgi:hypothetical protein
MLHTPTRPHNFNIFILLSPPLVYYCFVFIVVFCMYYFADGPQL